MSDVFEIQCEGPECGATFTAKRQRAMYCSERCKNRAHGRTKEDHFWRLVDASQGPDGCWLWRGGIDKGGYGKYAGRGAYRTAYRLTIGPIPAGMHLDHLCFNKVCVNPAHLEPVTPAENFRRRSARKTHCIHGHEYTEANTYLAPTIYGGVGRHCRICRRRDDRARRPRTAASLSTTPHPKATASPPAAASPRSTCPTPTA